MAADHFVPWSRCRADLGYNFVLSHPALDPIEKFHLDLWSADLLDLWSADLLDLWSADLLNVWSADLLNVRNSEKRQPVIPLSQPYRPVASSVATCDNANRPIAQ